MWCGIIWLIPWGMFAWFAPLNYSVFFLEVGSLEFIPRDRGVTSLSNCSYLQIPISFFELVVYLLLVYIAELTWFLQTLCSFTLKFDRITEPPRKLVSNYCFLVVFDENRGSSWFWVPSFSLQLYCLSIRYLLFYYGVKSRLLNWFLGVSIHCD